VLQFDCALALYFLPSSVSIMAPLVKLVASDNTEEVAVEPKIARMSSTIAGLMEALQMDDGADEEVFSNNPIPLPNVTSYVLKQVIEWCVMHKDDAPIEEKPDNGREKVTDDIPEDDVKFLEIDFKDLCELMKASNYLDVRGLFLNISKTIANMIKKCKTADEVRAKFHIYKDLTDEEEAAIRKENQWCDEDK
ncbi:hypothetical protein PENTCL1PPCAC_3840, partial [Pristionchus entomophagus]